MAGKAGSVGNVGKNVYMNQDKHNKHTDLREVDDKILLLFYCRPRVCLLMRSFSCSEPPAMQVEKNASAYRKRPPML